MAVAEALDGIFPRATGPYGASTIPNLLSEYGVPGETFIHAARNAQLR